MGRIEFAYADFQDIDDDYQEQLQDIAEPFVVLIEPQEVGYGFYHVFPGRECMQDLDFSQKVENASEITEFVRKFYRGDLMPLLPNENITETMENN